MDAVFKARTNFVKIEDIQGLEKSIKKFDIELVKHSIEEGVYMLEARTQDGDFPSIEMDDQDEEIFFSFEDNVMPFVEEGQVLIVKSSGAVSRTSGVREVYGYAGAYLRIDGKIKSTAVSLEEIYGKAANEFNVSEDTINRCQGEEVRRPKRKVA